MTDRHTGQMAAEARAASDAAGEKTKPSNLRIRRAVVLQKLAENGRDVAYAAKSMRLTGGTIKRYCRRFSINLSDYNPAAVEAATPGIRRKGKGTLKVVE